MADAGHDWTDEQILELEKRVRKAYETAWKELKKKNAEWLKEYDAKNKKWKADLKAGKVTKDEYDGWLKGQATMKAYMSDMAVSAARDVSHVLDETASIVHDSTPRIFAENANFAAYQISSVLDTRASFTLYDEDTVRRLISEQPHLLPDISPDKRKVTAHVKRKITNEVTQGILQGESIPNISKRLKTVVGMEQGASIRAARTACTGAENAGREDTYRRAEAMGIDIKKEWIATLDMRTRHSHRVAHRQVVDIGQPFDVGSGKLMYPGDPSGRAEEVYNCRCTTIAVVDGMDFAGEMSTDKLKEAGITYEEWKAGKMSGQKDAKVPTATGGSPVKDKSTTTGGSPVKAQPTPSKAAVQSSGPSQVSYTLYNLNQEEQYKDLDPIRAMGEAQVKKMTSDEIYSQTVYSGSSYEWMNGYKRGDMRYMLTQEQIKRIEDLDSSFDKCVLDRDVYVVRNTSESCLRDMFNRYGKDAVEADPSIMDGEVFLDKAYLSTTVNPTGVFSGRVLFHIRAPKGTKACYNESISKNNDEEELLIASGQPFMIKHAEQGKRGAGTYEIWMEAIV